MAYECEKSERAQVQAGVQAQAQVRLPAAQKRHEKMMKTGTKVMTMGTIQAAVGVRATTGGVGGSDCSFTKVLDVGTAWLGD